MSEEKNVQGTEEVTKPEAEAVEAIPENALTPEQASEEAIKKEQAIISSMNVHMKLLYVQRNVKAPKNKYNSFGKYSYRSAEDILESLKPLFYKVKATAFLTDEIEERRDGTYIKAIVTFVDCKNGESVQTHAYAKECEHKGMSADQCTDTASSYARKYALNALFLLDDSKDSDTDEMQNIERNAPPQNYGQQGNGNFYGNPQNTNNNYRQQNNGGNYGQQNYQQGGNQGNYRQNNNSNYRQQGNQQNGNR